MTETLPTPSEAPVTQDREQTTNRDLHLATLRTRGQQRDEALRAVETLLDQIRPLALQARAAGFTERDVERATGVSRQTVRNWQGKVGYATAKQRQAATRTLREIAAERATDETAPTVDELDAELRAFAAPYSVATARLRSARKALKDAGLAALDDGVLTSEIVTAAGVTRKVVDAWVGKHSYAERRRHDRAKAASTARKLSSRSARRRRVS